MYSRARHIAIPLAGLVAIGLAAGTVGSTAANATPPSDVVSKNAATRAEQAVQFWNRGTKANVFSFGYPAGEHPDGDKPFTGRTMKWCYGKTSPMPAAPKYNLQEHIGLKCALTAGASGGPLLYSYKSSTRTGYLIGVNSVAWDTDGNDRYDHISSPYFNTDTYNVYKAAANRWTGNMP